jgi:hypothetical protein
MRRARWSQMLNCLVHIVIVVDQERNHDAIEDLEWVSLARHPFVAATTLPVRRIQNDPGVVRATGYVDISTLKDSFADSSIFLLPRRIAGTPRESWRLLHIPYARLGIFLISHVGTEIALGKIKTGTRYQSFRSATGRYIFNYERLR